MRARILLRMTLPHDEVLLLHNARCSKSRAARVLLEENGIPFTVRLYLEEPLSMEELVDLRRRLDRHPREWIRTGEAAYRERELEGSDAEDRLLEAMAEDAILMERPILIRGDRARVGRPPEAVLELFDPA